MASAAVSSVVAVAASVAAASAAVASAGVASAVVASAPRETQLLLRPPDCRLVLDGAARTGCCGQGSRPCLTWFAHSNQGPARSNAAEIVEMQENAESRPSRRRDQSLTYSTSHRRSE